MDLQLLSEESNDENSISSTSSISEHEFTCVICQNEFTALMDIQNRNYVDLELHVGRNIQFCHQCIEILQIFLKALKG